RRDRLLQLTEDRTRALQRRHRVLRIDLQQREADRGLDLRELELQLWLVRHPRQRLALELERGRMVAEDTLQQSSGVERHQERTAGAAHGCDGGLHLP